jgi:nucleoside-diphosphate-sugar epimerase
MIKEQSRRLFCFGLGYAGTALARSLLAEGWTVAGSRRASDHAAGLRDIGVEVHLFDRGRPLDDAAQALAGVDCILSSVPPDAQGDAVLDHHGDDIAACGEALKWLGYLSTTGVYGNRDGGWVDENSARRPGSARSISRVAAEDGWLALGRRLAAPVQLFRLAGIYGPGRSALDRVRAGQARRVHRPGQAFSRIHIDDIVAVLRASIARPEPGAVYNVCDDEAAPPAEVMAFACDLLGLEAPPLVAFEDADMSDMAKSFWADNKLVRNDRLKRDLGVALKYPDYRAGLRAIFKAG